jgi:hypothetical protein
MVKISSKIQAAQFTIYVLAYPYPLLLFCTIDPATARRVTRRVFQCNYEKDTSFRQQQKTLDIKR